MSSIHTFWMPCLHCGTDLMPEMESMSLLWNRRFESLDDSFDLLSLRPEATVGLASLSGSASAITRGLGVGRNNGTCELVRHWLDSVMSASPSKIFHP